MNLRVLFLFLILISSTSLGTSKVARAAAGQHGVGIALGQVLLMGDFARDFSDSFGFGAHYTYEASEIFGVLTNVHYSSHSSTNGKDSLTILGISPNVKINLAFLDKLLVYSFGGLGLYFPSETLGSQSGSVTTLGLNLGIGSLLELDTHLRFGASISLNNVFGKTDSSTATGSTSGLNIGGTYLLLGLNVFYIF